MSHPRHSPSATATLHEARIGRTRLARLFDSGERRARRWTAGIGMAATASLLLVAALVTTGGPASASLSAVPLGSAAPYAVLGTAVTSTATVITGDLGISPGTALTGDATVTGATHAGDQQAAQAESDLAIAYGDAAGLTATAPDFSGDQAGKTFTAGVYRTNAAFSMSGILTLD